MAFGVEERSGVDVEVIPFRTEVVVDYVKEHHQIAVMRGVDEGLQIIGAAVLCIRCEQQRPVVTPVAGAGKIGNRHQFYGGNTKVDQGIQFVDDAAKGTSGRKGADMEFVDHRLFPRPPAPGVVAPSVVARIDHLARPMNIKGLVPRCRIWHPQLVVDDELVAGAGHRIRHRHFEPAIVVLWHRQAPVGARAEEDKTDGACRRRPEAKARPLGSHLGPEGHGVGETVVARTHRARPSAASAAARTKTTVDRGATG